MTGRGLRGRRIAEAMLLGVVALDAILALLVMSAPTGMGGPVVSEPGPTLWWTVVAIGVAAHLAGLAWMIRIIRADPEGRRSFWRSQRS